MLPETGIEAARIVAERIRHAVHKQSVAIGQETFNLTVSVGVAGLSASSSGFESVLREADGALYEAKGNGRIHVQSAKPSLKVLDRAAE
jgi:diguanylate cyclase (GGDEF)-like protein